jgi:PAS domain S-box-containing protein
MAIAASAAAILLRWLLDPVLGNSLPLVMVFGAVAFVVWLGGVGPAVIVTILSYVACNYLFIPPRGIFSFEPLAVVGFAAYLFTCGLIIMMGHAMRTARTQLLHEAELRRQADLERARQLQAARLLAAIVESSDDAIISKSLGGAIQSWNAAAERMFGYPAHYAIGRHISLVIPPERLQEEDRIIGSLRTGRRLEHFETERLHRNGRRIPVSLTISPIYNDAGEVVGASKIVRDVTVRREADAERIKLSDHLRRLAAELSEADTRKNEFLATLAHELRNPLAPLANMLEVLRIDDHDARARRQARDTMERQLRQLVRLVDDLLDLNRITHNRLELRRADVELAPILRQAIEGARPLLHAAGQGLQVDLPAEPVYLHADPARLAQVFGNLLNNASRYSPPGSPVALSARVAGDEVRVSVRDNGIGIPPVKLQEIFEMFTQLDRSHARANGGLGIGLTLARRLVGMHGGSIEARSAGEGKGAEFIVRLTVLPAAPRVAPATARPQVSRQRRVLVVDDNEDAAVSLAMLLDLAGNETHLAHDGEEALLAAEKFRPDVVLLDIGMPKMNGHEVCRRMRAQPWGRNLKVIALTGWGQEQDRRQSREAGFDGHLVKPVDPATLTEVISTV